MERLVCEFCDSTFGTQKALNRHLLIAKGCLKLRAEIEVKICKCGERFSTITRLQQHQIVCLTHKDCLLATFEEVKKENEKEIEVLKTRLNETVERLKDSNNERNKLLKIVQIAQKAATTTASVPRTAIDVPPQSKRETRVQERHMQQFLLAAFPDTKFVFNRAIKGACSRFRPDVLIEYLTHSIIVECDENRHEACSAKDEEFRLLALMNDLGGRPLVVLRFNPDKNSTSDGCSRRLAVS